MFDDVFHGVYYGSVVGGPYHHLLRSDEQSPPLTGTSAALLAVGQSFDVTGETVGCSPATTGTEPASLDGATARTCNVTTISYPPAVATCDKVPVEATTISYGRASSATDSIIAYHSPVDIQCQLSSDNQVNLETY